MSYCESYENYMHQGQHHEQVIGFINNLTLPCGVTISKRKPGRPTKEMSKVIQLERALLPSFKRVMTNWNATEENQISSIYLKPMPVNGESEDELTICIVVQFEEALDWETKKTICFSGKNSISERVVDQLAFYLNLASDLSNRHNAINASSARVEPPVCLYWDDQIKETRGRIYMFMETKADAKAVISMMNNSAKLAEQNIVLGNEEVRMNKFESIESANEACIPRAENYTYFVLSCTRLQKKERYKLVVRETKENSPIEVLVVCDQLVSSAATALILEKLNIHSMEGLYSHIIEVSTADLTKSVHTQEDIEKKIMATEIVSARTARKSERMKYEIRLR